jgi:tryptophanase
MFGTDPHTKEEHPARLDLVRLAIPRRVYTQSHMDYVLEAINLVWERRSDIRGMRIVQAPQFLRHFTAKFDWVQESAEPSYSLAMEEA